MLRWQEKAPQCGAWGNPSDAVLVVLDLLVLRAAPPDFLF
jgi:hypothetical protein